MTSSITAVKELVEFPCHHIYNYIVIVIKYLLPVGDLAETRGAHRLRGPGQASSGKEGPGTHLFILYC